MGYLAEQRALVHELRQREDLRLAAELVALAEIEPVFGHRTAAVRALLHEAAAALEVSPHEDLRGRVLVRLAATQISDERLDDADATLSKAIAQLPGDHPGRVEAAALAVRSTVRRGARERAGEMVRGLVGYLASAPEDPAERRALLTVAAAVAELLFETDDDRAEAVGMFGDLVATIGDDDRLLDLAYLARNALAAGELLAAGEAALHHLRAIVKMTREVGAPADEIHARFALAGMLTEKGDVAALEEAGRHLQIARDRALDEKLDDLHMLTLVGQAGYLARRGRVHGALDRCLEIARSAIQRQDLGRYLGAVTLMSTVYEIRGDLASAIRTFIEAEHGLGDRLGVDAARGLIRPHLRDLADRIGRDRFVELLGHIRAVVDIDVGV